MCGFLVIYSKNNFKGNIEIKNKFKSNLSILQDRGPDESSIIEFDNFLIGFNSSLFIVNLSRRLISGNNLLIVLLKNPGS